MSPYPAVTGYSGLIGTPGGGVATVNLTLQDLANGLALIWGVPVTADVGFSGSGYVKNVLQWIDAGVLLYDPQTGAWSRSAYPVSPSTEQAARVAAQALASPFITSPTSPQYTGPAVYQPPPPGSQPAPAVSSGQLYTFSVPGAAPAAPDAGQAPLTPHLKLQPRFLSAGATAAALGIGGPIGIAVAVASVIGGILGGLFGGLFGGDNVGKQIDQLKQVIIDIGNAITAAVSAVMHAMGSILGFLKGIWTDVLRPLLDLLKKVITQIGHLFQDILPKIVDWVKRIRQRILDLYERFVRPVILILQRLHTILRILAAFHVKWAARLDSKLQNLEARILQPMFWLLRQLNSVVNVLNWILDAKMLIQRALMINSLFATAGTWTKMLYNVQTGVTTYSDTQAAAIAMRMPTPDQTSVDLQAFRDTNSGPIADLAGTGIREAMLHIG